MNRHLAVMVGVLASGTMLLAQTQQRPPQAGLSLGGRVLDASTQRPVAGAAVTVRGQAPLPDSPTLVADAQGRFRFDQLRPGRYTIVATALGYLTGGEHIEDGMAPPEVVVTLEAGASRTDLELGLIKPAAIHGVVVDSDNMPVESAQMGALREVYVAGVRRFVVGSATTSDDAGQFRFNSLAPGRYVVCAIGERLTVPGSLQTLFEQAAAGSAQERTAFERLARQGNMNSMMGNNRGFAAGEFWLKPGNISVGPFVTGDGEVWSAPDVCNGGTRSPLDAPVIALAIGEQRLGETLVVNLAPAPSVSGVVSGPAGPVAWQGVMLESEGFDALGWVEGVPYAETSTDGSGRFTFLGVAPGNYLLKALRVPLPTPGATPGSLPEGETLSVQLPVSVGREAVVDVGVVMASAAQVRGRVVFAGNAAAPSESERARLAVSFPSADGTTTRTPFLRPTVAARPDGSFQTAGLLPGRYVVSVAPIGPWRLDRAELNGTDVSDVPFVVNDERQPEIVITMTDAQWRLAGTVRNERALPVATGRVVVFPTDRARWVGQGAEPRRQRLAEIREGAFTVDGLPAGEYFVLALPVSAASDWQRPDRFVEWAATAMRVVLGPHESRTLDLTFTPGGVR